MKGYCKWSLQETHLREEKISNSHCGHPPQLCEQLQACQQSTRKIRIPLSVRFLICTSIQRGISDEQYTVIPLTVSPWFPDHLIRLFVGSMIIWQAPRKDITSLNPHGFPSNRHSQHFCCWSASTWIIHHARKNRGGRNTSSLIACDVGACVQEKRAVQYMTRCFHSNVKPKQGVCLMELRGVTKPFASVSVCKWVHTQWILMLICRVKKNNRFVTAPPPSSISLTAADTGLASYFYTSLVVHS